MKIIVNFFLSDNMEPIIKKMRCKSIFSIAIPIAFKDSYKSYIRTQWLQLNQNIQNYIILSVEGIE